MSSQEFPLVLHKLQPYAVLIDFGHAAYLTPDCLYNCRLMTCMSSASEVLSLKPHNFPSNIWSLSMTEPVQSMLTEMVRGEPGSRLTREKCLGQQFFVDFLGKQWMRRKNESVRFLSQGRVQDELAHIESVFNERRGR
jgi:hypothetical protein